MRTAGALRLGRALGQHGGGCTGPTKGTLVSTDARDMLEGDGIIGAIEATRGTPNQSQRHADTRSNSHGAVEAGVRDGRHKTQGREGGRNVAALRYTR